MLCDKFGWDLTSGSWEEDENVKKKNTDRRTGDRWTDDDQENTPELKAKKNPLVYK